MSGLIGIVSRSGAVLFLMIGCNGPAVPSAREIGLFDDEFARDACRPGSDLAISGDTRYLQVAGAQTMLAEIALGTHEVGGARCSRDQIRTHAVKRLDPSVAVTVCKQLLLGAELFGPVEERALWVLSNTPQEAWDVSAILIARRIKGWEKVLRILRNTMSVSEQAIAKTDMSLLSDALTNVAQDGTVDPEIREIAENRSKLLHAHWSAHDAHAALGVVR